ncbi:hypothetical protein ACMGDM_18870 [Sphingomonas sp. DT-51]|uniref:hypothetical protein n=1 Tax=Sphingomonas sp. DT-51 TaxID=3396165 RepID=UPI003F1BEBB3
MLVPILLVLTQATPSAAPPKGSREVVVIGRQAESDLAECLARHCPPAQEVEAALQASVEQFTGGRYDDARRTLQRAIHRNRGYAATMPGPVSSLYATLATVAEHNGNTTLWRNAARSDVEVLRTHLGIDNPTTLIEELQLADDMIGLRMPGVADGLYRKVERLATAGGHRAIAVGAVFRRAWLALARDRTRDAERLIANAVALAGRDPGDVADLRDILLARIAVRRGDSGAVDALAARLRQSATRTPALLFAPAIEDINPTPSPSDRGNSDPVRFADVGYWIRPNGRTAEVEVLRTSGLGQWEIGILRQVRQRRYVPIDVAASDPGLYRIDRFTVRDEFGSVPGSRIKQRHGNMTVHVIDLTGTEAMNAAQRQRTSLSATAPHQRDR